MSLVTPVRTVAEAGWIAERLRPFDEHAVGSLLPTGYPAYVRILHPGLGDDEREVSWQEIATWAGRTTHPLVQWPAVSKTALTPAEPRPWDGWEPLTGGPSDRQRSALLSLLETATSTPDDVWFGVWDGYGYLPELPRLSHDSRDYLLFRGPLRAALPEPEGPHLWWPNDRAWIVATDTDLHSTYVAGPDELIGSILASEELEAFPSEPGHRISFDADTVNR